MSDTSFAKFDKLSIINLIASLLCVLCAALGAGLTMGLLSLDTMKLRIKVRVGNETEKRAAQRILSLTENHHLLLCTLLIFNSVANEALPIFLDEVVPSFIAIILSVTLVLVCGEVIPTAIFTGPNQLHIASAFYPVVMILETLFFPIAWPMAKGLDHILGYTDGHHEEEMFNRNEITAMLHIIQQSSAQRTTVTAVHTHTGIGEMIIDNSAHSEEAKRLLGSNLDSSSSHSQAVYASNTQTHTQARKQVEFAAPIHESPLSSNEVTVMTGVLALAKKSIKDVFIPLRDVNILSADQVLNASTITAIEEVRHSRIPVCKSWNQREQIVGFLLVKRLISVNPSECVPLASIPLIQPIVVGSNQSLLDVLTIFQTGSAHLALVSDRPTLLTAYMQRQKQEKEKLLLRSARDCETADKEEAAGSGDAYDDGKSASSGGDKDDSESPPDPSFAPIGIVTIEDIFEEMLQSEIYDEDDIASGGAKFHERASIRLQELNKRTSQEFKRNGDKRRSSRTQTPSSAAASGDDWSQLPAGNSPPTSPPLSPLTRDSASPSSSRHSIKTPLLRSTSAPVGLKSAYKPSLVTKYISGGNNTSSKNSRKNKNVGSAGPSNATSDRQKGSEMSSPVDGHDVGVGVGGGYRRYDEDDEEMNIS